MAAIKLIDMYKDFLSLVRKSRVGTVSPTEFTSFLNLAQEEVISQMLQVLDLNQKFMSGLLPLKVVSNQLSLTAYTSTSTRYRSYRIDTFPSDCRRISRVVSILSANTETKTNLIKSNEVSIIVNGVYSKPTATTCYYHLERYNGTDNIKLYVPGAQLVFANTYPKCILEYYISPAIIAIADVTDSTKVIVFNREVCTDIVNTAVRMYLENVQDARYQTYINELNSKK
jgi:hypothetical protein